MENQTPDSRWEIFGAKNFEEYKNTFVIKPAFHSRVPSSIITEYEMVLNLMTFSYYYYPMYDQAISKLMNIVELAVKEKSKQLGIPIVESSGWKRNLNTLINEIETLEPQKLIYNNLHAIRFLRNFFSHPENATLLGPTVHQYIYPTINAINSLFLPVSLFVSINSEKTSIAKRLESQFSKLHIMEDGKKYLIDNITVLDSIQINAEWIYLIRPNYIRLGMKDILERHVIVPLRCRIVKNFIFDKDCIYCTSVDEGTLTKIEHTEIAENVHMQKEHIAAIANASEIDRSIFLGSIKAEEFKETMRFRYNFLAQVE